MSIGVIEGLGRDAKILSSEAFGLYFWTRLARCISDVYLVSNCRLSNKLVIDSLFSIIATCSFPVVSRGVCALYTSIFLVVAGENYSISLDFNCSNVWWRVPILLAAEARPRREKKNSAPHEFG
jgi:hypothetical protein